MAAANITTQLQHLILYTTSVLQSVFVLDICYKVLVTLYATRMQRKSVLQLAIQASCS